MVNENYELVLSVFVGAHPGLLDSDRVVLGRFGVVSLEIISQFTKRQLGGVYCFLALVIQLAEHVRNQATSFASGSAKRFTLTLATFAIRVEPRNASIKST